jgi:hypothetical protein
MHTESEARTKWCPFALAVRGDGVSGFNRGTDMLPDVATFCLASACMAWRWKPTQWEWAGGDRTPEGAGWVSHPSADERFRWKRARPRDGYCGLAGQP